MMRTIEPHESGARVPIHLWPRAPPEAAIAQLVRLASQPWIAARVAAMPDLHVAHGVAVGTVFATESVVVPSALGGDLGCGVSAVRLVAEDSGEAPGDSGRSPGRAMPLARAALLAILRGWSARIPVGDAIHRRGVAIPDHLCDLALSTGALEHERERLAPRHLGTLGGGNHFVELDRTPGGELWLLVHSGSRGLGAAIGAHHQRAAEREGAGAIPGLEIASAAGSACIADLAQASRFAAANRAAIARAALDVLAEVAALRPDEASRLDVQHNFVALEEHASQRGDERGELKLWVHRKGAVAAEAGARVLIPGSMGTASYLAEGLGEPRSFCSASHGAGRVMTRREARERIAQQRFAHAMRRVVHDARRAASLREGSLIEEAPMAYRDIREVLEDEEDLLRPLERLEPLLVLKG